MKKAFKVLGVLLILAIGFGFLSYGKSNKVPAEAGMAYKYGDFEAAALLYEKGISDLEKLSLLKVKFLQDDIEGIALALAWSFYYQGYYEPEKYKLAEEVIKQELEKEESIYKDQFHNLQALVYWQKGVELFIKLGKKAIYSKELSQFLNGAIESSGSAVKALPGDIEAQTDFRDITDVNKVQYNYEFFRQDPEKLKKNMQRQAKQKQKDRKMKGKTKQLAGKKNIKPNKGTQKAKAQRAVENKKKTSKMKGRVVVPGKKATKSEDTENTLQQKKKKKKKKAG